MSVRAWCRCGWHGEYDTAARADFAARQHSCAKHEAERARRRRGLERRRTVDRTTRECTHKLARHVHGTHACYVLDRCHCDACRAANAAYEDARRRRNAYGQSNYVDAEPSRAHVLLLARAGIGLKTVAARSGVAHGTLWKLMYGKTMPDGSHRLSRRVTRRTEAALLAVRPTLDVLAGGARVDPAGSRRRVRALVSAGWSVRRLAERAGLDRQVLHDLALERTRAVTVAHARTVRDLYESTWDVPPPAGDQRTRIAAARSRRRAAEAGWPMPLDLDDDLIDDPAAPEPVRGDGEPTRSSLVLLDEWLHLVRSGEDHERAARRVGTSLRTVEAWARRWGRDDILTPIERARAERYEARTHLVPTETHPRRGRAAA